MGLLTPTRADLALLLIWAALLFGTFACGSVSPPGTRRIPFIASLASSLLLVLYAWRGARAGDAASQRRLRLTAYGMSWGFVGDLCMAAGLLPVAIAVFAGGHVCYLRALDTYGPHALWSRRHLPALLVALLAGAACWYGITVGSSRGPAWLRGATLAYCLLLSSLVAAAAARVAAAPLLSVVTAGATLFFLSDAAIAARMFKPALLDALPEILRADFVWLTYGPAQLMIIAGLRLAVPAADVIAPSDPEETPDE